LRRRELADSACGFGERSLHERSLAALPSFRDEARRVEEDIGRARERKDREVDSLIVGRDHPGKAGVTDEERAKGDADRFDHRVDRGRVGCACAEPSREGPVKSAGRHGKACVLGRVVCNEGSGRLQLLGDPTVLGRREVGDGSRDPPAYWSALALCLSSCSTLP
jgi:hypothetical protein